MERIKSLSKIIIALLMALALTTLTACDVLDDFFGKGDEEGGTGDGNVYQVVLETDGGTFTESLPENYTSGIACDLPANGTKEHYTFDGWYADSSFSGNKVTKIPTSETGDKTYYAKWNPETYNITYSIKSDASFSSDITSYTYNTLTNLPAPTKNGYTFNGWYSNVNLTGNKVTQIAAGEFGEKTFYGEWVSQGTSAKKWTVTLNDNGGTYRGTKITEYTEGVGTALPQMEKDNCNFDGWCENKNLSDNPVFSISSSATGNKEYWAKFTPISADALQLSAYGGYEEGAYVEFNTVSGVSSYSVAYKIKDSADKYTDINSELIRVNNSAGTVRADIVGIKKGDYTIQVTAGSQTKTKDVSVTSYDRSGYAHFNRNSSDPAYLGVGGYNDDGTPKSDAEIIYVTEANKNTVKASYLTSNQKGLVAVLSNAHTSSKPVIVRIIGRISAWTWNEITYDMTNSNNTYVNDKGKTLLLASAVKGTNNQQLPTSSSTSQSALVDKYNTLNKTVCSENLEGLTSYITYSDGAYDSCWNDCSIGGSSSHAKNVTVEGIGTDAEIFQWGMTWKYAFSIEVRNLTFTDYTEDACSFQGDKQVTDSSRLWVHHCTFNRGKNYWDVSDEQDKHDGDGATDFKSSSNITIAYNHYVNNHKTGLIGSSDSSLTSNVTFHHNYYDQCESRLPLGRNANMHMYNNYYYRSSGTNMSIRANGVAFIENCYFDNAKYPVTVNDTKAVIKLWNCIFSGKSSDNTALVKVNNQIVELDSRMQTITYSNNNNSYGGVNFNTLSATFYDANGVSTITTMYETSQVPTKIPQLAGVHQN